MTSLAETQELFWQVIAERKAFTRSELESVFVGTPAMSVVRRLDVYGGMYINRLVDALRAEFPRVAESLGEDEFFEVAEAYIRKHPSVDPSITHVGRELPRFLRSRRRRDLADLAAIERTRSLVFDAKDETPLPPNALADIPPEKLPRAKLTPIEALRLIKTKEGTIAVFRRDYAVHHVTLSELEGRAVRLMLRGRTLTTICNAFAYEPNPGQVAFATIGRWLASGWITAIRS